MKFERPKGIMGSEARNWIDANLPNCPFCRQPPLWELATKYSMGWHRNHFRCPECMAVLSVPLVDLAGPVVGALWLLRKISRPEIVLRVESVGGNADLAKFVGKEYGLDALRNGLSKIKNLQP